MFHKRVRDYSAWRSGYDSNAGQRAKFECTGSSVYRNADDEVLAEPVGDPDASLLSPDAPPSLHTIGARYSVTAERVAAGNINGALTPLAEDYDGPGAWERPPTVRQTGRDNARTLTGQADERRQPFTGPNAETIRVPTLIIIGAETSGALPLMSRARR
jgi:hypothetical protein